MGLINSPLGVIRQKIGNMRFSTWKGKNTVARQPEGYNDAKTPVQVQNRNKFTVIQKMGSSMLDAIRLGFKKFAIGKTELNAFAQFNLNQFLSLTTLGVVNLKNVLVSRGNLLPLIQTSATFTSGTGVIILDYTNNANGANAMSDDKVIICGFDTVKGVGGSVISNSTRLSAQAIVTIPQLIGSLDADCVFFAFAKSTTNSECSNSINVTL